MRCNNAFIKLIHERNTPDNGSYVAHQMDLTVFWSFLLIQHEKIYFFVQNSTCSGSHSGLYIAIVFFNSTKKWICVFYFVRSVGKQKFGLFDCQELSDAFMDANNGFRTNFYINRFR